MSDTYFPIHPQILRIGTTLSFDVFVRVGEDKYNRLFKSGKLYSALIHAKIFKYSVPALYVNNNESDSFYNYLEEHYPSISQDMFISIKSQAQIVHDLVTSLAKAIMEQPNAKITRRYQRVVHKLTDFIYEKNEAEKHLISLTSSSFQDYNHLVNVGIYSLGLLKK